MDDLVPNPDLRSPAVMGVLRLGGLIPGSVVGVMLMPENFSFSGEIIEEVGDDDFVRRMFPEYGVLLG